MLSLVNLYWFWVRKEGGENPRKRHPLPENHLPVARLLSWSSDITACTSCGALSLTCMSSLPVWSLEECREHGVVLGSAGLVTLGLEPAGSMAVLSETARELQLASVAARWVPPTAQVACCRCQMVVVSFPTLLPLHSQLKYVQWLPVNSSLKRNQATKATL